MEATVSLATTAGRYVYWGVLQISVTNLAIIAARVSPNLSKSSDETSSHADERTLPCHEAHGD